MIQALKTQRTNYVLIALNIVVAAAFFVLHFNELSPDNYTYLGIANGILNGEYSYWYFLEQYVPDTLRTPGYPFFLAAILFVGGNVTVIKVIQLLLYIASILLLNKAIIKFKNDYLFSNLFLLQIIPCVFLPYYAPLIYAEMLVVFLISLLVYVYVIVSESSKLKPIMMGIILSLIFYSKPIFLFFPVALLLANIVFYKFQKVKADFIMVFVFFLMALPYGFWNYKNHNTFKLTPLEGGGGILYLGFWQHKLPNFNEYNYWGSWMGDEMIKFVVPQEVEKNIAQWNTEWNYIDSVCAQTLSTKDSLLIEEMNKYFPRLFRTYHTDYTSCREKILIQLSLEHIKNEPVYYLKTRIYTFFRLQITGINFKKFNRAKGIGGKIEAVYPFIITGLNTLLFLVAVLYLIPALFRKRDPIILFIVILTLYGIVIHIPMAMLSRYTIPVRLLMILISTELICALFKKYVFRK